ncbi:MAG: UDP-N-acetylmuramate dehydrogenase [Firmicutes bacterium]|nr:UDP-N-acetylmuramate dehydrogenase [Alicyclobacillaceae bacterium]MCL6497782.1 UDP-N-acetylmuramate dehydrogenase [Bacillota bacterium]
MVARDLERLEVGRVLEEEPLWRHTSFRIGGPAAVFLEPRGEAEMVRALDWLSSRGIPLVILGLGTNLLVSDRGVRAVVVSSVRSLKAVTFSGFRIRAGAGVGLVRLARLAQAKGLSGLEFAVSIPGTLGGALVMNAGAHGSAMAAVVRRVTVWQPLKGAETLDSAAFEFDYRHSRFQKSPEMVALAAELWLEPGDPAAIQARMAHFLEYRLHTQPVGEPNAGSVFKNPAPLFAGQLIDSVGAKGWREGDAEVSTVHANFIVNRGRARAIEVLTLMRRIRRAVYQAYHVLLRPEIRWVGPPEGGAGTSWENLWYAAGEGLTEPSA